ncbi:MAG: hypothetical protein CEN90_686 [Parcubacteria group bacterium Licking1014_17]|nr:MAG: hypothetical protein CEN90_686 [Parcubacteria group bacterium Licking1014_17]
MKWIPNAVSISRFFPLAVLIFLCALWNHWLAAAILSVIAIVTDCLDGWLAFKLDAGSELGGQIIDPLCDLAFSVAQVAGAFFAGVIGWGVVAPLVVLFLSVWLPLAWIALGPVLGVTGEFFDHGTPSPVPDYSRLYETSRRVLMAVSRIYYAVVVAGFTALYFYKAMGINAAWLILPAIPLAWLGARSSISHHRMASDLL